MIVHIVNVSLYLKANIDDNNYLIAIISDIPISVFLSSPNIERYMILKYFKPGYVARRLGVGVKQQKKKKLWRSLTLRF